MLYKEGLRRVCHSESPADAAGFLDELSPPLALDVRISLYGAMIFHVPYLANLDTMVGRRGADRIGRNGGYILVVTRGNPY